MTIDEAVSLAESDPPAAPSKSDPPAAPSESGRATVLRDAWDSHAKEWIDWVRAPGQPDSYWRFHRKRFLPLVPTAGRLTLDIGCGEGRVARDLQTRGHKVLGVDWSSTMCQAAATHWEDPCSVIVGDAAKLPLSDASVDCAVAFMSLQDIDDLLGAVKEIARVLADGRKLALAIVHPMYSGGTFSPDGGTPDETFVIQRSYFKPEVCISSDSRDSLTVTFYREHRPLQAYVQALLEAGFSIDQLHELTDEDQGKPLHRVPMFLDILATRLPRKKSAHLPRRGSRDRRVVRATTTQRILVSYLSLGLSGLIGVAAATIALLAVSHLRAFRIASSHIGFTSRARMSGKSSRPTGRLDVGYVLIDLGVGGHAASPGRELPGDPAEVVGRSARTCDRAPSPWDCTPKRTLGMVRAWGGPRPPRRVACTAFRLR
jgi:SAM-dependent methyltransferase